MTEAEFWQRVRRGIPPWVMARRIEDASGNLGTFDTFLACRGSCAWLELKVAGPQAKPSLRPGQSAFAGQCVDAGVPAAYLVGSSTGTMRLLGPHLEGADWRDHLVGQWAAVDRQSVVEMLEVLFEGSLCEETQTPAPRRGSHPRVSQPASPARSRASAALSRHR